ncbi:PAAR domain-containing protein [Burkholderia sp. IMCC1007]|uniref:PAAR domain-containing protein n=1 Tax=Burkholderia sp. IMCC1007 TaxID=3004104 RepID=UPI0022B3CFEC|nr:PAAR domain-containing protein [Burkholderia sp. IMCC1007]
MKRYDIVKGDTTTAAGLIVGGDANNLVGTREQAYEGDPVSCPACKTVGKIACDGPRIHTTGPDGRQAALSDDLCVCQCSPAPRLIASQISSFIEI